MTERSHRARWIGLAAAWLAGVTGSVVALERYANEPGELEPAPAVWPAETDLALDRSRATLLLFIHPRCPCSRATLGELERVLTRGGARVRCRVVLFLPAGEDAGWSQSDLWERARSIPGVDVRFDAAGLEARRFAVQTSGQALLYGPDAALRYSGGITASRGHEGDNQGRTLLEERILEAAPPADVRADGEAPVYGCPILPSSCCKEPSTP